MIICVLVDNSLSLIEMKQRSSQRPNLGVDFAGTDFVGLARAFGGYGVSVDNANALRYEAVAAQTRPTFTLIAAQIARRAYDGAF